MMKWMNSLKKYGTQLWQEYQQANREREEKEFFPAVLEVTETPPSPIARVMLWTLMLLLVTGLLWTLFGEVDEVAVAQGKVIPRGQVKVVQAQYGGVIKSIRVRDGQQVKEGEVLVELDPTVSSADLAQMRKQVAFYRLEIERLLAEQTGTLFSPRSMPELDAKDIDTQLKLYESRTQEMRQRLAQSDAKIREQRANLVTAEVNRQKFFALLAIAKEREEKMKQLLDQNAVSYFNYLDYQSRRLELQQNLAAQSSEIVRSQSALQQSFNDRAALQASWDRDVATKLVDDRKQLQGYEEELKKAEQKSRQATILSPATGRVTQLAVHTVGGVMKDAEALMIIVPDGTQLEVEAWAANKDIGFLQIGQSAEVKVETFNFQRYGTIEATVSQISADATDDKEKGRVYRIVLELQKQDVQVSGREVPLSPGMTATAEIKIRQKKIFEYFLDPFRKYKSEALRER